MWTSQRLSLPPAWASGRVGMPPAGLAIKAGLIVFLFIILIEIFWHAHPIKEAISSSLPGSRLGPQIVTHGAEKCLPRMDNTLTTLSLSLRTSCLENAPFEPAKGRIGVVTAQFGTPSTHYGKAFQSHHLHSMIHSTELHVMCDAMIDDLWNKPAFILSLLLDEMLKPESQRLEWIMWVDRDTIILDQCRPVSSFLPPEIKDHKNDMHEVHMLISNDMNGLNNGIFLMKVSHWSINLLLDILAFRDYKPDVELVFTEQSAMELVLREPKFSPHVQYVPQQWFNAYPQGEPKEYETRQNEDNMETYHVRRGDFLVHFAGRGDKAGEIMAWTSMLRRMGNIWVGDRIQRDYSGEIDAWWRKVQQDWNRIHD